MTDVRQSALQARKRNQFDYFPLSFVTFTKSNLVHFSLKIWNLVASNLLIFLRIQWP